MTNLLAVAVCLLGYLALGTASSSSPHVLDARPALSLLEVGGAGCTQVTAAESAAQGASEAAGCCSGFQCPYAGGVCCGGVSFCCPNGTVCLASGGAVAPQCGRPAREVCGCTSCPCDAREQRAADEMNRLGAPGGVPAVPNFDAAPPERLSSKGADEFKPGDDFGGAVEWKPVKARSETKDEAGDLEPLGPRVHRTNYSVDVQLHVANLMYTYYITESRKIDLRLREDIARNENMAVQSVEIANVSPLRIRTEGTAKMEAAYLRAMRALRRGKGNRRAPSLAELAAEFSQVSGVRVDAKVWCGSQDHAQALARHIFLTFDKQNPHPFNFKALQGLPPAAHGNAALPFDALESSKVFLGEREVNDHNGIAVARTALAEASGLKAELDAADRLTRKLDGDIERERRRIVRVDRRDARLDDLKRRRREAQEAKERAQRRVEEAAKAAHKAEVQARHEAVTKREASEAGKKDAARKAREEENKKHEKKEVVKEAEWDVVAKPVTLAERVQVCGNSTARVPQWSFAGDLCVLSGAVCAERGAEHLRRPLVATPRECRPAARLILNRHDAARRTFRVDAWTSGRVAWNGGLTRAESLSLDGIAFPRARANGTAPLELAEGWVPYGGSFAAPTLYRDGALCVVSGLAAVKGGSVRSWTSSRDVIARLPEGCRPEGRLVFNLNHHKFTMRVDVLPSGEIEYVSGRKAYKWVSLSGVQFFANATREAGGARLELENGYKAFELGYRAPTVTRWNNICAVSGVVTGSQALVVGKVPKECAPVTGELSFWTNQGSRSFQINVRADGTVARVPPVFDSWVSLDGIFYTAGTPGAFEGKLREEATARMHKENEEEAKAKAADAAAKK